MTDSTEILAAGVLARLGASLAMVSRHVGAAFITTTVSNKAARARSCVDSVLFSTVETMGYTPARHLREQARVELEKEKGFKDNESKFTEFDMGCSAGQISACNSLGEWYSLMRQDFRNASELYMNACFEHRYPQACLNLGHMLLTGKGDVSADEGTALRAFTLGCEAGNADACSNAGKLLLQRSVGSSAGAAPSAVAAYADLSRAPVNGQPAHARGAGLSGAPGQGTPLKEPELVAQAERLLRLGCEGGTSTTNAKCCGMLATLHMSPRFSTAPGMRRMAGSSMLAHLQTACAGEYAPACTKLAALHRRGGAPELGISVPKDEAAADALEVQSLRWLGLSEARAKQEMERRKGIAR